MKLTDTQKGVVLDCIDSWPLHSYFNIDIIDTSVVVNKSLALYPKVPSSISGSTSMSDEILSHVPVLWDALNQNHCRLSLRVSPNIKPPKR